MVADQTNKYEPACSYSNNGANLHTVGKGKRDVSEKMRCFLLNEPITITLKCFLSPSSRTWHDKKSRSSLVKLEKVSLRWDKTRQLPNPFVSVLFHLVRELTKQVRDGPIAWAPGQQFSKATAQKEKLFLCLKWLCECRKWENYLL